MITRLSVPSFPGQVKFCKTTLIDEALEQEMKVNRTAALLLNLIDGHRNISAIAKEVANKNHWDFKRVESDFSYLVWELNQKGLLNVKERFSLLGMMQHMFFTLYISLFFPLKNRLWLRSYRWDFPKNSEYYWIIYTLFKALLKGFWWFWLIILFAAILGGIFIAADLALLSIVILVALMGGALCHEFFHYWTYCQLNKGKFQGFIVTHGTGFYFYRRLLPPSAEFWVSLVGPLTPSLLGLSVVFMALSFNNLWLIVGGIFLLFQGVVLLPFAEDGKRVFSSFWGILRLQKFPLKQGLKAFFQQDSSGGRIWKEKG